MAAAEEHFYDERASRVAGAGQAVHYRDANSAKNKKKCNDSKMFVGGLSPDTKESHLLLYFKKFGEVVSTHVVTDKKTRASRRFGYVVFDDPDSVNKVMASTVHVVNNKAVEPKRMDLKLLVKKVQKVKPKKKKKKPKKK